MGKLYNPLFIHSKVGLGKTHLLQAIGNKTLEVKPNYNIKYIPAETFINQWIISLQRKETNYFREYYNSIDLLLIDDIQFFAGKESTQEVFFHIFNYLHQNNKQIVLTSDKPPQDLIGIPERLVSRFNSGMVVDIFPPELEDRLSILKDKVARLNLPLDDQKIFKIAQAINTNIRDLEGVLNKIQARIRLMPHLEFTDQELESLLSVYQGQITNPDLLTKSIDTVTPETILQTVCRLFSIDKSDLLGSSREKNVALARQIAFWLCKHELDLSYPVIGKLFGGRNHTTVMHGYNKIQELLENDHKIKDKIILAKKILSKQC
jgi:chromosomal replication initiator protein